MSEISATTLAQLETYVAQEDFTLFYKLLYDNGSTISGLYTSGPTGYGMFGRYSHEYTIDWVGVEEFRRRQNELSRNIAQAVIRDIRNHPASNGRFQIPETERILEIEIEVWKQMDWPVESYVGNDLIDWMGYEVPNADFVANDGEGDGGKTVVGAGFHAFESLMKAEGGDLDGVPYYSIDSFRKGAPATKEQLLQNGMTVNTFMSLLGPTTSNREDIRDQNNNIAVPATGVFRYHDQLYWDGDVEDGGDGFYYMYDESGQRIPVGVTAFKVNQLLEKLGEEEELDDQLDLNMQPN